MMLDLKSEISDYYFVCIYMYFLKYTSKLPFSEDICIFVSSFDLRKLTATYDCNIQVHEGYKEYK